MGPLTKQPHVQDLGLSSETVQMKVVSDSEVYQQAHLHIPVCVAVSCCLVYGVLFIFAR